jgi:single-stranded DNA-binding protein
LAVPREGVRLPLFFCRVNEKDLITEFKEKLKKGDIIILEGFLQTQKVEKIVEGQIKIERVSSINCYGFTFLDSDSVNIFSPLNKLTQVVKEVRKIEFGPENKAKA